MLRSILVYVHAEFPDGNFCGYVELELVGKFERFLRVLALGGAAFLWRAGGGLDLHFEFAERDIRAPLFAKDGDVQAEVAHRVGIPSLLHGDRIPGMREQALDIVAVGNHFDIAVGVGGGKVRCYGNIRKPGAQCENTYNDRHDCGGQRECRSSFLQRPK